MTTINQQRENNISKTLLFCDLVCENSNIQQLPFEMILEISKYLPVKTYHKCNCEGCDNEMLDEKHRGDGYNTDKDFFITIGEDDESYYIQYEESHIFEEGDKVCIKCLNKYYFWCEDCECYKNIDDVNNYRILNWGCGYCYCEECYNHKNCFECEECGEHFEESEMAENGNKIICEDCDELEDSEDESDEDSE